ALALANQEGERAMVLSKQIAALREAAQSFADNALRPSDLDPKVSDDEYIASYRRTRTKLEAVLTDTEEAASQYQLVDDEHVVVRFKDASLAVAFVEDHLKGRLSPQVYPGWLKALSAPPPQPSRKRASRRGSDDLR
ncbi:hypothetical protein LCGC14_2996010, partial [marine sediment metagenome]